MHSNSSNKRRGRLLNLETVRCCAYQRAALIRGRCYFKVREMKPFLLLLQNKNFNKNFHCQETKYNKEILISTISTLFYCLHSSSTCILVQLLVEYGNYSNKDLRFIRGNTITCPFLPQTINFFCELLFSIYHN